MLNVNVYGPGASSRKRNSPDASLTVDRVASTPCKTVVTPGRTPPCWSLTVPLILPFCTCAVAEPAMSKASESAAMKRTMIKIAFLGDYCPIDIVRVILHTIQMSFGRYEFGTQ